MKKSLKSETRSVSTSARSKQRLILRSWSSRKTESAPPPVTESHRRWFFYALTAIVVVGGLAFWQADLAKDPPMYFDGLGQSLATDPPQYAYHARNQIRFGDWDPFDYSRWTIYQHSIVSFVSWVWMSLTEATREHANMAGVMLSLGGLVFLLLGLSRHHKPWVLSAVAFACVVNINLLTHGRLSYLENGLLFWTGALFWIYAWWGERTWGAAIAGAAVAAAMLTGKLFGALLLPSLLLAIYFGKAEKRRTLTLAAVGGFAATAGALIAGLYGGRISDALAYTGEQSWGLRGFPEGLKSPWAFVEHLISYGFDNRLYYLNPELLLMIVVGGLLVIQFRPDRQSMAPTTRLAIFWGGIGMIGLMPLNYSPVRYALFVIPAVIIFCLTMFDRTSAARLRPPEEHYRWTMAILMGAVWLALFHVVVNTFFFNTFPTPIRPLVWGCGAAAAVLTWLGIQLLRKQTGVANRRAWVVTLALVLATTAVVNGARIYRFQWHEQVNSITEANRDLGAILNAGAVVSGPYGPVLTFDTDIQSFIHLFQVAEVDSTLFVRQPVTHLLMDISNYNEAVRNYPQLAGIEPMMKYWVRDVEVGLYRIDTIFGNPTASAYEPGAFETAHEHLKAGRYDAAAAVLAPFARAHPESKAAGLMMADLYLRAGMYDLARGALLSMADRFPTDFSVQLQAGQFLLTVALQAEDRGLMVVAQKYFERGATADPYRAQYAMNMWEQISRQYGNTLGTAER